MYLRYPLPEDIKQAILKYGEDAYGIVVKYLVENFGLSRNKAQQPAQKIIEKVLAEKEKEEDKIVAKEDTKQEGIIDSINIEDAVSFICKKNTNYNPILIRKLVEVYVEVKKSEPKADTDILSMLIYRKSLFSSEIRELIPESLELRKVIDQVIKEIELSYSTQLHDVELEYNPLKLNYEYSLILDPLSKDMDTILKDAFLHKIGENVALFPSLLLLVDSLLYHANEKRNRIVDVYEKVKNQSQSFSFSVLPEPFLPLVEPEKPSLEPNERLIKALQYKIKTLIAEKGKDTEAISVIRKELLFLVLAALLADKLLKILLENKERLSDRMEKKLEIVTHEGFTEIFAIAEELAHGSWPRVFRSFGDRVKQIKELFGINEKNGDFVIGEREPTFLADREIVMELERVAQFNKNWSYLNGLISVATENDARLHSYVCSIIYGIVPDNFAQAWGTRKYFGVESIEDFMNEFIAYKNINRYILAETEKLYDSVEKRTEEVFIVQIDGKYYGITKEELKHALSKLGEKENQYNAELIDLILFVLADSDKERSYVKLENIQNITLQQLKEYFYSTTDFLVKTSKGIAVLRDGEFHYFSGLEFYDFLYHFILGETYRDLEIEIKYSELNQLLPKPIVITVDNIVRSIPSLNQLFGDIFEIGFFFVVSEYIELTHPSVISKITIKELVDSVRNYTIYPGIGFIKVSVVGKEEDYVLVPLNILQLSYGLEAFITETSTMGRIALEYGFKDKWVPELDKNRFIINKISSPPIIELLKDELMRKNVTRVESESYKIQLGRFVKYFHEFMEGKKRVDLNSSLTIGFPEYPLNIALCKNEGKILSPVIYNLKDFLEIVKLAFERSVGIQKIDELAEDINRELEKLYIVRFTYPLHDLSSPLKEFLTSVELGTYKIKDLLELLAENEHYSYLRKNLLALNEITDDIIFKIQEKAVVIETKYNINDAVRRLLENVFITGEAVDGSWQLSGEMKLLFYQKLSERIDELLRIKIGKKKVYEIIFPK